MRGVALRDEQALPGDNVQHRLDTGIVAQQLAWCPPPGLCEDCQLLWESRAVRGLVQNFEPVLALLWTQGMARSMSLLRSGSGALWQMTTRAQSCSQTLVQIRSFACP
jgi:hypothetical protein